MLSETPVDVFSATDIMSLVFEAFQYVDTCFHRTGGLSDRGRTALTKLSYAR